MDYAERMKKHGIRNATLMALMPCETSSTILNSTNGIEPIRSLITYKQSKDGVYPLIAPGYKEPGVKYDLLWEQDSTHGYLKVCAVLQKYIDQAISVNTSYNPAKYPGGKLAMSTLLKDVIAHYKWGGKTLYYNNTHDGAGEVDINEDECDSCKI